MLQDYMKMMGCPVKDKVTGFAGVVDSICFDLYGCVQCGVRPPMTKDEKLEDARWFDHKRLDVTDAVPVMTVPTFASEPEKARVGAENGPAEKPAASIIAR